MRQGRVFRLQLLVLLRMVAVVGARLLGYTAEFTTSTPFFAQRCFGFRGPVRVVPWVPSSFNVETMTA